MSQFNVIKTNETNKDIISILKKVEDRLIVHNNYDNNATLYFDYDKDTRLEIRSLQYAYKSKSELNAEVGNSVKINVGSLEMIGNANNDNIYKGSLVTDGTNIGIITNTVKENSILKAIIHIIYKTHFLEWNDYF